MAFAFAVVMTGALAANGNIGFRFETDHPDCLYRCGEEAVITVTATNGAGEAVKEGFARIEIDNYGRKCQQAIAKHEFAKENPFTLRGKLEKPGFLRVKIDGRDAADNRIGAWWSVGYEPEKIRPATERPADFDAFWDGAVAKFAKEVPIDAKMVLDEKESATYWKKWNCYRVTFATVPAGRVIRGTLTIPTTGKGPYPITVHVPGAGSGEWQFGRREGRAYLVLNVLDYPCFPDKEHPVSALYADQNRRWSEKTGPGAACWYFHGDLSKGREDFFYYGAILGINRAIDWVADLPEIDATKDFRYEGMSQGGAFGIYLTALNRHFTRALLAEPAITDVCGMLADGRQSGWPILPEQHEKRPFYANMMKILPYFDTVHFAPRVKVPVRCYVGFVDILCPPHAVWAGFNSLGSSDKKMLNVPGLDHGRPHGLWRDAWERCDKSWTGEAGAEFWDYPRRELKAGGAIEAFDNPMFETPDVPGIKAGDTEKEWRKGGGYNGSGGIRFTPKTGKQIKHDFGCRIKSLEPGRKYVLSVDVRTVGKAYCHIYWSCKGKENWFPKRVDREGGYVTHEIAACVPEGKSGENSGFHAIVTPQEGWTNEETYVEFDNVEMREDVPEWYLANTWPIHNQIYNDYGRIRLYSDFLGEYVPKGDETVYLCELLDAKGGSFAQTVVKDAEGVITADFGKFAYTGAAKLKVSLMDRTARLCLGVKEIAIEAVPTPKPRKDVVTVDEIGRLHLGGKPWMPLGFYTSFGDGSRYKDDAIRLKRLQEMRASGFDFMTEYWPEGFDRRGNELYDMVYTNGFHMLYNMTSVYHHRNDGNLDSYWEQARGATKHPAVVGFYVFDELPPSYAPFYDGFRRRLQREAPDEITWYSNIAAPAPWLVAGDIQGNGCYPVDNGRMQLLDNVEGIARAAKCRAAAWLSYGQCFNYANYRPYEKNRADYLKYGVEPTEEQMLTSALIFATYGSRAFQFFIFEGMWRGPVPELYEGRWKMMQSVGRTIRSLEPWIMSSKPLVEVPHTDLKGRTRIVKFTAEDGRELVIAVGLAPQANEAEFEFRGEKKLFKRGAVSCEIYR